MVRYDRWGTGLSDRGRADFGLERDIEILAELADHLKLRRFTLLGPSHGGPLAVAYALRQPRRVSHLVLYGSRASALTSGGTWAALRELILANWPVAARSVAAVATPGQRSGRRRCLRRPAHHGRDPPDHRRLAGRRHRH